MIEREREGSRGLTIRHRLERDAFHDDTPTHAIAMQLIRSRRWKMASQQTTASTKRFSRLSSFIVRWCRYLTACCLS